jgi:5-methyltetrahydropteroyltriglutamate--homocysteine methyltransferase
MDIRVDDVGSFPLPRYLDRKVFDNAYILAREAIINGKDIRKDEFLLDNFYKIIVDSFRKKLDAGFDVVNYPQHYDMHKQFIDVIHDAMGTGTYIVAKKDAIIPEVYVIEEEAKRLNEITGNKVSLRVCVTGPLELYLKEIGPTPHRDVLLMFAETVKMFAENSILDSKYVKTEVIALDEPSLGFQEISTERDILLEVLERAFDFKGAIKHIHLHSPSRVSDLLNVKNLDVLSFEYAASPQNIESISKNMLVKAKKQIRIGVSRTDIDSIIAGLYEKGISKPTAQQLVESELVIRKRYRVAKEKYGEVMTFAGPDCGLGGWPTQEAAQLLLKRTVNAVKQAETNVSQVRT